jgi:type IV pilus assembly protein PilV
MHMSRSSLNNTAGFSLIEVLVTLIILMTGILGLAGLQGRALTSQMESYQRSQALILIKDMAYRINANRADTSNYATSATAPLGVGSADCTGTTTASIDLCEWSSALKGSAEGTDLGTMIGARGCIYELSSAAPKKYLIAVAWQGLTTTSAPAVDCGEGSYGNDALRRVITIPITIANLS